MSSVAALRHHRAMSRILMIDDDEKLVGLVREYLEPHGYAVDGIHDGNAGLEAVRARAPELVILDLMLPGLDGLELCRRLRSESEVPILMLTARGDDTDRVVGLEMGADDYLPKPFNPRELLARLRAILRRAQASAPEASSERLEVGGVLLDPGTRTVRVGGRAVELTTAEFDLLAVLMRSAGRVLSRDQILEAMHGPGWATYDRTIDVHVSRLRQKIEDDPHHPRRIRTLRGAGYQFARSDDG